MSSPEDEIVRRIAERSGEASWDVALQPNRFRKTLGGLWVPDQSQLGTRNALGREGLSDEWSFVRTTVGYRDLHRHLHPRGPDIVVTWDDVGHWLLSHSLEQVTETVSRISLMLNGADSPDQHDAVQDAIGRGLGVNMDSVRTAAHGRDGHAASSPPVALFHERQLLALLKYALRTIPATRPARSQSSLLRVAVALMIVNDLLDADVQGLDLKEPASRQRFELYLFANSLFNRGVTTLSEITRGYLLFVQDSPALHGTEHYIDLPKRLARATGLPADRVWQILFAFYTHFLDLRPEDVDTEKRWLDAAQYFADAKGLSAADIPKAFNLAVRTPDEFHAVLSAQGAAAPHSFDMVVFARSPLIRYGDRVSCLSLQMLEEALGAGMQHRYLDEQVFTSEERRQFLDYRGDLIEAYVDRTMRRIFPSKDRYVDESELSATRFTGGGKSCDGAIVYGDAIVLFEVKSRLVPLGARSGMDVAIYQRMLGESFGKAMAQIRATVSLIESGAYASVGLNPSPSVRYYPLVVTFDLAIDPLTYAALARAFAGRSELHHPRMAQFQALEVRELEQLEVGIASGTSLLSVLQGKLADENTRGMSFRNYFLVRGFEWANQQNPFLAAEFSRATERARVELLGTG